MNIDRQTPIGKAVPTEIERDARPEVSGHIQENDLGRILRATEEDATSTDAEVEGHRSFAARMLDIPEDDADDQAPEVEGHIKRF